MGRVRVHAEGVQCSVPKVVRRRILLGIRDVDGAGLTEGIGVMRDVVLLLQVTAGLVKCLGLLEKRPATRRFVSRPKRTRAGAKC